MKITGIDTIPINVPIHKDNATLGAKGYHASSPFLIVQVRTDEGIDGLGEVSCTPLWSGEDQVSAAHFIETVLGPELIGHDPRTITRHIARINAVLANNPFTKAGIEIALWDIAGKAAGIPVHALLGGAVRDSIRTKYSVSGLEPAKAAAIAVWAVEQGFTAMKVKVGMDPVTDLERVRAVRAAVGPDVLLGVDANGGWSPSTAVYLAPRLEELGIAFIEQPVPAGDPRWLARVREAATVPVIADESLSTAADALSLIAGDAADVFSIYVGMGGGDRDDRRGGAAFLHGREQPGARDRPGGDDPPRDLATGNPARCRPVRYHQPLLLRAGYRAGAATGGRRGGREDRRAGSRRGTRSGGNRAIPGRVGLAKWPYSGGAVRMSV